MEYIDQPVIAVAIIVIISFCIQFGMFVRPEQLEKKHREILEDAENKFASLSMVNDLKSQFCEIKQKIDQIYEILLEKSR
jgi:hypothetical protein